MNAELQKKLEEAAREYADEYCYVDYSEETPPYNEGAHDGAEAGFLAGAEYGYKEAIALAKEWLKDTNHFYQGGSERFPEVLSMFDTIEEMISDFEADMNKLLEE